MSEYTVTSTAQYMENHIAAAPLGNQSVLYAAKTSGDGALLFSIDSDNVFRATVGLNNHPTGWETYPLGTELVPVIQAKSPGATVVPKTFAVAQTAVNGAISIVLVVTVTPAGGGAAADQLWLLSNLASSPTAAWLTTASDRNWTSLAFDAAGGPSNITAGSASVAAIFMAKVAGAEPTAAVTLVNPASQIDEPYLVGLTSATPHWTYLVPEQNFTALLSSAVGQPLDSPFYPGIYKLYTYNQPSTVSLTFQPSEASAPYDVFTVPAGASALATIPVQVGADNYTDLLVAGANTLTLFPYNVTEQGGTRAGTTILNSPYITNVSALHATSDGTTVTVWGINGNRQIFYSQAPFSQRTSASAWSTPLPLLSNVTAATPYISSTLCLSTIFAIVNGAGGQTLYELHKDPITRGGSNRWNKRQIKLPSTNEYMTLDTYTTRILITGANNVPAANTLVELSSSSTAQLYVNGMTCSLTPATPVTVTTDNSGCLTLMHEVSTMAAASYGVMLSGQSTVWIDPTTAARTTLSSSSGSQLQSATFVSSTGQTTSLLAAGTTSAQASGLANGLQQVNAVSVPITAGGVTPAPVCAAPQTAPPSPPSNPIEAALGDIVQAVVDGVEAAFNAVVNVVDGVVNFYIQIGETAFHAIVNVVEDIGTAIVGFFQEVISGAEALFRFLAFMFDWDDILAVKNALVQSYTNMLQSLPAVASQLQSVVDGWFTQLETMIANATELSSTLSTVPNQTMSQQQSSAQPSSSVIGGSNAQTDPRLNWSGQHAQNLNNATSSTPSPAPNPAPPLPADSPLAQLETTVQSLGADLQSFIAGNSTLQQTLLAMAGQIATLIVALVQDAVDAMFKAIEASVEVIIDALTASIDIPLLSALYADISGGDSLSILHVFCLLQAAVTTISYKLVTGGGEVSTLISSSSLSWPISSQQITALQAPSFAASPAAPAPTAALASAPPSLGHGTTMLAETGSAAPKATASEDDSPGSGYYATMGSLRFVRAITGGLQGAVSYDLAVTEGIVPPGGRVILWADLLCRMGIASVQFDQDIIQNGSTSSGFKQLNAWAELVWNGLSALGLAGILPWQLEAWNTIDGVAGIILGATGEYIAVQESDTPAAIYAGSELAEVLQFVAEHTKQIEADVVIVVLRALAFAASGIWEWTEA